MKNYVFIRVFSDALFSNICYRLSRKWHRWMILMNVK